MTTATRTLPIHAQVRCSGVLKNGKPCNALLARIEASAFDGRIELKCRLCHTKVVFT